MYAISKRREFICQHYFPHEKGREARKHSHRYVAEVIMEGRELDEKGYLIDLNVLDQAMSSIISNYADTMLNDHPDFNGLQPSAENFARAFCTRLLSEVQAPSLEAIEVRIWENDTSWASFREGAPR